MIYIATKNVNKISSIRAMLQEIAPKIIIRDIAELDIPPAKEKDEEEISAVAKANHYYFFLKKDVLCEDTGIYTKNTPDEFQFGANLHRRLKNPSPDFHKFWKGKIETEPIIDGVMKRVYIIKTSKTYYIEKLRIPVSLSLDSSYDFFSSEITNPLNKILIPLGFNKSFEKMNIFDRKLYRDMYLKVSLQRLVSSYLSSSKTQTKLS